MAALSTVGAFLGLGGSGSTTINTAAPVNTDDAISQADEQLRRRSRQGATANLLNGNTGAGSPSSSSTGAKTLLGG